MWIQAIAICLILAFSRLSPNIDGKFALWVAAAVLLGLGTALVYPTLIAAIGDVVNPRWRASAVGVYRFWRDLGYAIGALVAGVVSDLFGIAAAIGVISLLTASSGVIVAVRMRETNRELKSRQDHSTQH
jgi:MFS family permease